jgi:hypothetical protein
VMSSCRPCTRPVVDIVPKKAVQSRSMRQPQVRRRTTRPPAAGASNSHLGSSSKTRPPPVQSWALLLVSRRIPSQPSAFTIFEIIAERRNQASQADPPSYPTHGKWENNDHQSDGYLKKTLRPRHHALGPAAWGGEGGGAL